MRLALTARGVNVTPALRQMIERRIGKLETLLNDSVVSMHVVVAQEKYRRLVEIVVHARGDHMLHGDGDAPTWQASLKQATDKIAQQAHKMKEKWASRKRRGGGSKTPPAAAPAPRAAAPPPRTVAPRRTLTTVPGPRRIIRASRYVVSAMSAEDAARKVEAGEDDFLIFRNAATDNLNILYRRKDGNFGLIEPEA